MNTHSAAQTILVVDDSPAMTALVSAFLEDAGFEVVTASGGADALELARSQSFAAVLCDFKMPEMNGLEVLAHLRTQNNTQQIPFILMTGGLDRLPGSFPFQPEAILQKPFTPADLNQVLMNVIAVQR